MQDENQEERPSGESPTDAPSVGEQEEASPGAEPTAPGAGLIDQPTSAAEAPPAPITSLLSELSGTATVTPERVADLGGGTSANFVAGGDVTALGTTDTGDLLATAVLNTGVYSRQLSPVMTDTRVRGFRYSEIRTTLDGAAWFPVRPDADTPLSRFDSNIVDNVAVIRGPYNVRLGPGFSFIDVTLRDTPRHEEGLRWNGDTKFTWDTNGEQWYGRQSVSGGNQFSGWRIGYGHRGGSDYTDGAGDPVAASYNVRDWDFSYGVDLTDNSGVEFTYIRTDMTDVELPGQINDFASLVSDGFSLRYQLREQGWIDRLAVHGWYNAADFRGTADSKTFVPGNPNLFFPPTLPRFPERFERVNSFGDTSSSGGRALATLGDAEWAALTFGADATAMRQTYLEQRLDNGVVDFGVPDAVQDDVGLFAESRIPVTHSLTLKTGGRIDFVQNDASPTPTVDARRLALQPDVGTAQSFTLHAGYLSSDYKVNEELTLTSGVGYAERSPSPTELYADVPHLSIMQEGAFFIPHGNLLLKKEKALQGDLGLTLETEVFQGGLAVFYTRINDFITYQAPHIPAPSGPHSDHTIGANTDAELVGGEAYFQRALNDTVSAFGALSHVQGEDLLRNEPLWGIAPLESRVGLRLEDPCENTWGVEYVLRMVARQTRVSSVGLGTDFLPGHGPAGEIPTPGFSLHSIRGFRRLTDAITFTAAAENFGDRLYREHLDTRLDLTQGRVTDRGIPRRGASFFFALQADY
ncbi:MAG: TonB-dependent receptor [Planctomycetes bacterium]|nr:TonB-dependent receptor [Planctomycetota bacterium]